MEGFVPLVSRTDTLLDGRLGAVMQPTPSELHVGVCPLDLAAARATILFYCTFTRRVLDHLYEVLHGHGLIISEIQNWRSLAAHLRI